MKIDLVRLDLDQIEQVQTCLGVLLCCSLLLEIVVLKKMKRIFNLQVYVVHIYTEKCVKSVFPCRK